MREFRTSGSVGASGGRPPEATRPWLECHVATAAFVAIGSEVD